VVAVTVARAAIPDCVGSEERAEADVLAGAVEVGRGAADSAHGRARAIAVIAAGVDAEGRVAARAHADPVTVARAALAVTRAGLSTELGPDRVGIDVAAPEIGGAQELEGACLVTGAPVADRPGFAVVAERRALIVAAARARAIDEAGAEQVVEADVGAAGVVARLADVAVLHREDVAVVVEPVADLGVSGVDRAVVRLAVAVTLADTVAVLVDRVARVAALVHVAVAVVVDSVAGAVVAAELVHPRIDVRVTVVAVLEGRVVAAGCVRVSIHVEVLVDEEIAVVVETVAELGRARIDGTVRVVAVVALVRAVEIVVDAHVTLRAALVDVAVAVVVESVAELGRTGEHGVAVVVAVAADGGVACRRDAGLTCVRRDSVAVAVAVAVVGVLHTLVDRAVAVVVSAVADLRRARIVLCLAVVAVVGVRDVAGRHRTGERGVGGISVAVAVGIGVEGGLHPFVDVAVAVVVGAVTDLRCARIDVRPAVVAVVVIGDISVRDGARVARRERVAVAIVVGIGVEGGLHPLVDLRVAVVVGTVTDFAVGRVVVRVAVVAVGVVRDVAGGRRTRHRRDRRIAEAVVVVVEVVGVLDALVDVSVAVVVDQIADFRRGRVDGAVAVVAVVGVRDEAVRLGAGIGGH